MSKLITCEGHPNIVLFHCPGCECAHQVHVNPEKNELTGASWGWNGSMDAPTFSPSIKVTGTDMTAQGRADYDAWYAAGCPKPAPESFETQPMCCHSFVLDGNIQFLGDCTHKLANQTVPIPDWETS
jgi:hypothetical protein